MLTACLYLKTSDELCLDILPKIDFLQPVNTHGSDMEMDQLTNLCKTACQKPS